MAAFFWIHGGANANWNTVGNWSATSGGGSNAATPSITSDVTFDGVGTHGNEASIISAAQSVLTLTFTTGYTASVTINTAVILTIAGNFVDRTNHSWIVSGTGSVTFSAACSITSNGQTLPAPVTFSGVFTKTLVGDWAITGLLTMASGPVTINKTTAEVLSCAGWNVNSSTTGNINITLTGGTWSGSSANTVSGIINLAGNVTISGGLVIGGCTVKYTSGTITSTSSTFTVSASTTFDTNGTTLNNITSTAAVTYTLNSTLTLNGTLNIGDANTTFAGTAGFVVSTLTCQSSTSRVITFVNTVTYTINTALNCFRGNIINITSFTSDHATNKAIIILSNGATCNVLASFTRIDASSGRAIYLFNGTVTTCNNVFSFNDALPPASSKVIHAGASY
jgi:hypothetical protein